jgi:hypothetical protein
MLAYLRRLLRPLTHPYRVLVIWEDAYTKHYALTYADALQWAACYPLDAFVLIRSRTLAAGAVMRNDLKDAGPVITPMCIRCGAE